MAARQLKPLREPEFSRDRRAVGEAAEFAVAVLLVELRRLKAEGIEIDARAIALARDLFGYDSSSDPTPRRRCGSSTQSQITKSQSKKLTPRKPAWTRPASFRPMIQSGVKFRQAQESRCRRRARRRRAPGRFVGRGLQYEGQRGGGIGHEHFPIGAGMYPVIKACTLRTRRRSQRRASPSARSGRSGLSLRPPRPSGTPRASGCRTGRSGCRCCAPGCGTAAASSRRRRR